MQEKPWQVVQGPEKALCDVSPDTQLTDPWTLVLRRDGAKSGDPGAEIVIYAYAEFSDPNGQRSDGSWPDVRITAQVGFEIREANGDVNIADYAYKPMKSPVTGEDQLFEPQVKLSDGLMKVDAPEAEMFARGLALLYAESARFMIWNEDTKSPTDAVMRLLGHSR